MSEKKKLKTITNGPRWIRFLFVLPALNAFVALFQEGDFVWSSMWLMIHVTIIFLFWLWRKVRYDAENVYFISGSKITTVPFAQIRELKLSKTKINSQRFWILKYEDPSGKIKTRRFFHGVFQGGPDDFHEALKKVNHKVEIQFTTNYSQMVDSFKKTKKKKDP